MRNDEEWKAINNSIVMLNKWTQRLMYTAQTSQGPILEDKKDLDSYNRRVMKAVVIVGKLCDELPSNDYSTIKVVEADKND